MGTMANKAEMPSWVKSIMTRLDAIDRRIMDIMEGRLEGTEVSLCKKLDTLIEHPSLPNQIFVSGYASHELQGNQTNFCTLVNEDNSQLSVNDSLSLSEPNMPSFCDDNVQREIVDTLVNSPSVESIVESGSTLSYGSHEDQLVCENDDVEHVGRMTKDGPRVVFVINHDSIEGIFDHYCSSIGVRKCITNPCPWRLYPFDFGDHLKCGNDDVFWNYLNVHGMYGFSLLAFKSNCCSKKSLCFPLDKRRLFLVSCHTYVDKLIDSPLVGYSGFFRATRISTRTCTKAGDFNPKLVGLVVLDGEFNPDDREDWTEEEFSKKVIREREGKRPLLTGDLNHSAKGWCGISGVREGVSKPLIVRDHRGETYRKHYPPTLDDEIWQLERIAKDGASHKRLKKKGILCVKDFVRLFVTDPSLLREMLACGNNIWEKMTEHVNTCPLDNSEWYIYNAGESIVLLFNCIYELVGATLDGQNFQSLDKLDVFQKRMVENFKRGVYKKLNCLVLLKDHSLISQAVLTSKLQIGLSHIPSSSQQTMKYSDEQVQVELQSNSDHTTISQPLAYTEQLDSPTAESMPENFHGMQAFSSNLASSFLKVI
ncbi:putative protein TRIGALACTOSYLDIACYLGLYCEROL 1, chloroplastic-like isoform X1 [Capsicum annuum]|nr:putative protein TRIGALACTOSYLDIACYLGLYCEROL 1, chloroplastic-like isoform X1 [Capsicum annuum]